MNEEELLAKLAECIQARPIIDKLPNGLRQHALLYEKMLLDDYVAQKGALPEIEKTVYQNFIKPLLSKHLTPAAIAGAVTAAINYFQK